MSFNGYYDDIYWDDGYGYRQKNRGAGRVLEAGEEPPSRAPVSLQDYLVHKKPGRRGGKALKTIETLSESDDADLVADTALSTHASAQNAPLRVRNTNEQDLTSPNRYLFDYSREGSLKNLFDCSTDPGEVDGTFRYATHTNGDLSVFQWSTHPDFGWSHIGRINSSKSAAFRTFISQLFKSDQCKNENGTVNADIVQKYTMARVQDLCRNSFSVRNSIPSGPASPLTREISRKIKKPLQRNSAEAVPQFSTPTTALASRNAHYSAGSSIEGHGIMSAEEASEKRKALIEEHSSNRNIPDPFVTNPLAQSFRPHHVVPDQSRAEWKEREQRRIDQELRDMGAAQMGSLVGRNGTGTSALQHALFTAGLKPPPADRRADPSLLANFHLSRDYPRDSFSTTRPMYTGFQQGSVEPALQKMQNSVNNANVNSQVPAYLQKPAFRTNTSQLSSDPGPAIQNIESRVQNRYAYNAQKDIQQTSRLEHPASSTANPAEEAVPARHPNADPYNRPLNTRDIETAVPRNLNWDTLITRFPLRPEMPTRPWFGNDRLHSNQQPENQEDLPQAIEEQRSKAYNEELHKWWNSGKKELPRHQGLIKHTLDVAGQKNDQEAQKALTLFVPVYENLDYYANRLELRKTDEGYVKMGDYFSKFSLVPWAIDRYRHNEQNIKKYKSLQEELDNEPLRSYWQEDPANTKLPPNLRELRLGYNKPLLVPSGNRANSNGPLGSRSASMGRNVGSEFVAPPSESVRAALGSVAGTNGVGGGTGPRTGAGLTASHRAQPYPPPPGMGHRGLGTYGY